jgi:hypothetical protein
MFKRVHFHPRLMFPTTMTSADFSAALTAEISPGKNAVLPRTIAPFTCRTKSNGLSSLRDDLRCGFASWRSRYRGGAVAVLCQLTWPGRPCMGFLSIDLRVSHSLLSATRSPVPPWLLLVLICSFLFISIFTQGT